MLRVARQFRPEGISLNVTQHGQVMLVLLDGEGLEAALPDMAAAAVMPVVAAHMGGQEPLHPAAEIAVVVRPKHKMEVIGHQAVAQETHGESLAGGFKQGDEGGVIRLLMKDLSPAVPAIKNVVAPSPQRRSCSSWHSRQFTAGEPVSSIIK